VAGWFGEVAARQRLTRLWRAGKASLKQACAPLAHSNPVPPTTHYLKRLGLKVVTLYVLKATTGKRYVGITNNLPRRLEEHRNKVSKGGQILHGHFFLFHTEEFPDYNKARNREKFLKSGQGRAWLDSLELKSQPATGWYSP
jgi:putative endonuclease